MSRYACCCTAPEDTVLSINLVSKKRYYQNNNNNGSTDRGRSQNPIISAKTTSHLRVSRNTDNSTLFESENGDFVKDFAMPPQHAGLSTNKILKNVIPSTRKRNMALSITAQ
ncbi:hypothetical protein TRVL_01513 [Trypanosoma vivax]|nr:hypothetical protein TRVL_01513 [Trypanosoma vivax]